MRRNTQIFIVSLGFLATLARPMPAWAAGTKETSATARKPDKARSIQAEKHFRAGQDYLAKRRYLEAVGEFRRSYQLAAAPAALYQMGRAYQAAKRREEAAAAYYRFLGEAAPGDPLRVRVKDALQGMKIPVPAGAVRPLVREATAAPAAKRVGGRTASEWRTALGLGAKPAARRVRPSAVRRFMPVQLESSGLHFGASPAARLQQRRVARLCQTADRLLKQKRLVQAYGIYRKLVRLVPQNLDIREQYGVVQALLGDFGGALRTVAYIKRYGGEARAERARLKQQRALTGAPARRR